MQKCMHAFPRNIFFSDLTILFSVIIFSQKCVLTGNQSIGWVDMIHYQPWHRCMSIHPQMFPVLISGKGYSWQKRDSWRQETPKRETPRGSERVWKQADLHALCSIAELHNLNNARSLPRVLLSYSARQRVCDGFDKTTSSQCSRNNSYRNNE